MRKFILSLILSFTFFIALAQHSSFETAAALAHKTTSSFSISNNVNNYYLKTMLPSDGTVKLYLSGTHKGGSNGGFTIYTYDKSGRNVHSKHIGAGLRSGDNFKDTVTIFSRAADTLYFLIYNPSNRSFDISLQYELTDLSENDAEPNDNMQTANYFRSNQAPVGHIGYVKDGRSDHYDYFKTLIPENGTVRVYIDGKHTGGSTGTFGFYVYDKTGRNIYSTGSLGSGVVSYGQRFRDTLDIFSQNADTLYMLIYLTGGRSYQYNFSYEIIEQSKSDEEPNNTFATANPILMGETRPGQIGYTSNGITDQNDYYKTLLPGDGTVTIYIEGEHTGGSTGSFGFYAYDNSGRNILSNGSIGKAVSLGGIVRDTLEILSRGADSIYLLVYNAGGRSFNYSLSYELKDQSINDDEPNNTNKQTTFILPEQEVRGHIGYTANGITDHHDYYKTLMPEDGTIRVIIEGLHTGGSTGSFGFYMEDISGRIIFSQSSVGKVMTRGQRTSDTLYLHSRQADSIVMYVYMAGGRSISYSFRYDIINTSPNDPEPNDIHQQAVPLNEKQLVNGHTGYYYDGKTDHYDHYRTVLPKNGTVRIITSGIHTGGSTGSYGLYAYDKSRRNLLSVGSVGQAVTIGGRVADTAYIYSRADDTLYINLYSSGSRSFSYSLSYEVIDTSFNDVAPNEGYVQATEITHNELVRGHIGYVNNGVTDHYDYYKTLLPVDGSLTVYVEGLHTGGSNGSFGFYVYDKQRRNIFSKGSMGSGTITMGTTIYDTIRIDSRAADSLYLVVYSAGGRSFSYTFRYEMPNTLPSDPEPNNTYDQAVHFTLSDTLRGLIGYVQSGVTDHNDYYKAAVPARSTLKVYLEAEHTGGSRGTFALYAYDKNRRLLASKTTLGNSQFTYGESFRDTVTVACNPSDSVYILIYQAGGRSFSYSLKFDHIDNSPKSAFSYTRTANDFGFVNESVNTNSFTWNFGNGTTSTVAMPVVNFKPGVYNVRLIASNSACNFRDTMTERLTITGIESFTPRKGGIGGDLNMQIFGGGLDTTARIVLRKGSTVIEAEEKYDNEVGSMLGMVFDLHFAESGVYDLEVAFTNGDVITYDTAFTIEPMIYPETYSQIVGPAIWRTGRPANFNLVVGNKGNTVARGVIVALAWPKAATLEFYGKQYKPDEDDFLVAELEEYNETIRSSYSLVQWIYDSINTVTPIDTFNTKPYDGYVRFLYVPVIAPNSTYELPFTLVSEGSSMHKMYSYTVQPNQFGSCETYNISSAFTSPAAVELMINTLDWGIDELKVPPATKIPAQVAVKSLKVTQKHIDVSSNVLAHRMWNSYYNWKYGGGGENHGLTDSEYYDYYKEGLAADEFAKNQLIDLAIDQGINLHKLPANAHKNKLTDQIHDNNQALVNKMNDYHKIAGKKTGRTKTWRMKKKEAAAEWQKQFEAGEKTMDELRRQENLESIAEWAGRTKNAKGELEALIKYIEENCPEHKEQLEKLKEELNKEKDIQNEHEKDAETRTSYDPNAIYGPSGFNQPRYINSFDRQGFVIMFENVDTARADAQIVRITDTIDKTKFDLSTFELGNITIGGKWYKLPKGRQEVMMQIDLTAERNMFVRLNASLDTATGIATWLFTSIDPQTGDLPDFDGFLPPNKLYPSGEGSVTFTVNPHRNLTHGTVLESRASIIFDFNEPIITNTWVNTIDAKKPSGQIQAEILQDTNIVIRYSATDTESGVNYYNLYISEDNREWVPIGGGNQTSQIIPAEPGKTYYFYVESQDRVGNVEEKSAVGEASVKVPDTDTPAQPAAGLMAYPIPSDGRLTLEFSVPVEQRVTATVFSPSGVRVAELYNAQVSGAVRATGNLAHLANGIYFVRVSGDKGLNLYKKIVIMK